MAEKCKNCGDRLFLQDKIITLPKGFAHKKCNDSYYRLLVKRNAPKDHPDYIKYFGKPKEEVKKDERQSSVSRTDTGRPASPEESREGGPTETGDGDDKKAGRQVRRVRQQRDEETGRT